MSNLQDLRANFPAYAKDIKINLGSVLTEEGAPYLSQAQIYGIALACAYATAERTLIQAITETAREEVSAAIMDAAKGAASLMAMNNVYYRFIHLSEDPDITKLPANLRMTLMGNPGVDKTEFELYSLAVSAINGCGMCMQSHVDVLKKAGLSPTAIQSAIRIAAVINAAKQVLTIEAT